MGMALGFFIFFKKALKQHLLRKSWARTVTKGIVDGNIKYFGRHDILFMVFFFFFKFVINVDFKHCSSEKWSCL